MEEEKRTEAAADAAEEAPQLQPPTDGIAVDAASEAAENAAPAESVRESVTTEETTSLQEKDPSVTAWDFGGKTASETKTVRPLHFFAVFGVAFAICMVLLICAVLWGDGKFEIIRNVLQERIIYVRQDDGSSGLLTPNEAADAAKKYAVSISVTTAKGNGIGSGFVYSADGYIITNYHVIEDAEAVQVILPDGKAQDATVRGYNEAADVAVLKIAATDLVPATLGSSAELLVGDAVVAIGTPAKLDYAGTATFGTVSATRRLLALANDSGSVTKKMTVIQTDTQVNPGNSGGPLVDMYGRVVGVVVMKITDFSGTAFEGIGFALPIDGVKVIADEIIASGSFNGRNPIAEGRSLLGVTGHGGIKGLWYANEADANGSMASSETQQPGYHYMAANGVYVMGINGGNAMGKIVVGDIVLAVDGLRVSTTPELIAAVNRHYAGETVTLTVLRAGQETDVEILLYEEAWS